MSKISFHVELDNRVKKDGTQNIQLRITQARKMYRVSIGHSIEKRHWNEEKKEVRKTHPQHLLINAATKAKILEVEKTYLKSQVGGKKVSASTLKKQLKKEIIGDSFLEYAKLRSNKIDNPSTKRTAIAIINKLEVFLKGNDLLFEEITYDWIKEYERYLKSLGNSVNTIHNNLKILKATYNDAIKSEVYEPEKLSPWSKHSAKKSKTIRTRLTLNQIHQLEKLDLQEGTNKDHARNFFLFSFFMQGMRVTDVLQLCWSNIVNGRLEYTASKTQKARSKKMSTQALAIVEKYRKPFLNNSEYIFPFLKKYQKKKLDKDVWRKKIEAATSVINNELKEIAPLINAAKLTTHTARHSFAEYARIKTGGNVTVISAALDHSSISITQTYFNEGTQSENDDLVDNLFG